MRPIFALVGAALGAAVCTATGCTIPITAQTITGGALNVGAMLFVDRYNEGSGEGEGSHAYDVRARSDTLAALFEAALAEANRAHLFPRAAAHPAPQPDDVPAGGRAGDDVILARAPGRAWRTDDPPAPETFPGRQWTPAPLFSVRAGSPEVRGDTLLWVVTHRAARQVAFLLVPGDGGAATRVALLPYDPPADVLLSVPSDHAQRNAVEALHQAFYFVALEHLGPGAFTRGRELDP
jgi:hypothetical protein